jgi:hypothetical protein
MKKNPSLPKLKKKKARQFECMLGPSHWLHEISPPKRVWHHFWLQLIDLAKNTLINWGYLFFVGTCPIGNKDYRINKKFSIFNLNLLVSH